MSTVQEIQGVVNEAVANVSKGRLFFMNEVYEKLVNLGFEPKNVIWQAMYFEINDAPYEINLTKPVGGKIEFKVNQRRYKLVDD